MPVVTVVSPSLAKGKLVGLGRRQPLVSGVHGRLLHPAGEDRGTAETRLAPLSPEELWSVAEGLVASSDAWVDLSSGYERRWERIAETSRFEAWVVGWPAGGRIEFHDYGTSAGVVAVGFGTLIQTSVDRTRARVAPRSRVIDQMSGPLPVVTGRVHDLINPGPGAAISVHVFSPRLTSMSYYQVEGDLLRCDRTEQLERTTGMTQRWKGNER
jgi:hypothetical protein